jgi:hypothetical protein
MAREENDRSNLVKNGKLRLPRALQEFAITRRIMTQYKKGLLWGRDVR